MYKFFLIVHWLIQGKYEEDFGDKGVEQPEDGTGKEVF
jgi:hypothetical protein